MSSSRQVGAAASNSKGSPAAKSSAPAHYPLFTPSGMLARLSERVERTVASLDKQASSGNVLSSAFYSIVLGLPLKMCRFVLFGLGSALGVKQRAIVNVQRKYKTRRSAGRKSKNGDKTLEGDDLNVTPEDGVKFDFGNSPNAARQLSGISPSKRPMLSSQSDADYDDESSCEEDSEQDEIVSGKGCLQFFRRERDLQSFCLTDMFGSGLRWGYGRSPLSRSKYLPTKGLPYETLFH